jgi:hypothetical protein
LKQQKKPKQKEAVAEAEKETFFIKLKRYLTNAEEFEELASETRKKYKFALGQFFE